MTRQFNPWLHEYYARFTVERKRSLPLNVVFLIGSADISGGTYVIFEHALWLKRHGAKVTVVPLFPLSNAKQGWHPALEELRFAEWGEVARESFDIAVATWWPTVYELPRLRFRHAVYFVQSAEPRFYADGQEHRSTGLAELTYTFKLPVITIATWLQMYLAFQHDAPSFLVRNGIDKSRFVFNGPAHAAPPADRLRILVEGPVDVAMKGVDDAVRAGVEGGADEVWLLTSSECSSYPGVDRVFSRIPAERTGDVYRSCQVLVKLSHVEGMYGPPLEMFHCGGTVVTYDVTGHDEYIQDDVNGLVVPMGDHAAASGAIRRLKGDPSLLGRLRKEAVATASAWPDWESSSAEFGRILHGIDKQAPRDLLPTMMGITGAWTVHDRTMRDQ